MATYKVAQDVEADDKLLGPFTFRQFIYLIIVAIACLIAYGLSRVSGFLVIIPLPVILFFSALALPLRKDQPMEIYLGALLSFYIKPRKRLWQQDGIESLIEITVPQIIEVQRIKDITQTEAERRLSYLANIVDTGGWAIRNVSPVSTNSMASDAYFEAQQTEDILDIDGNVSANFNNMITQSDEKRKQQVIQNMQRAATPAQPASNQPIIKQPEPQSQQDYSQATTTNTVVIDEQVDSIKYDPYPDSIRQSVIQPLSQQVVQPTIESPQLQQSVVDNQQPKPTEIKENTSDNTISPDIINLANNTDLSIETISREAHRIQDKSNNDSGEVFISLH